MTESNARHRQLPPIYVGAPDYTPLSGGAICLHLLCHILNKLGLEAYITANQLCGRFHTPQITDGIRAAHESWGRQPIAVYPEVTSGNPLQCSKIVRYLLNRPGERAPAADWLPGNRSNEFLLHFADEFRLPDVQSKLLYLPVHDRSVYKPPEEESPRQGFLVYSHRVRVTDDVIPAWARPYTFISMQNPKSPAELAALYQTSTGLIVFERTGALYEALLCHCPAVAIPNQYFKERPLFSLYGNCGVGWGNSPDQLEWSKATVVAFNNMYRAYATQAEARVRECFNEIFTYFALDDVDRAL